MPSSAQYTGTRLFFLSIGANDASSGPHGAVLTCRPDGSDLHTLVSKIGTHPDGIAVDTSRGHVYYTSMGEKPSEMDGFISRMNLDGNGSVTVIPQGVVRTPKQCTIEPESRMLYWCDREGMRVWRAKLDDDATKMSQSVQMLYQAYTAAGDDAEQQEQAARKDERNHCVGIAVDRKRGKILWTQKGPSKGGQGRLFSAGIEIPAGKDAISRSDVEVLLDGLPEPIDLEMDVEEQILYKTDRGAEPRGNTVSRVHLDKDGEVVEDILVEHLHEAIGVSLDKKERIMYFTDLGGSIYSSKFDGSDKKEIFKGKDHGLDLTGIWVVHLE